MGSNPAIPTRINGAKEATLRGGFSYWYDIMIARGDRVKYLGHIQCPTDGYSYITDAKQVVIYFSPDSVSYYTEVICNECGHVVEGNIDKEFLLIFMGHGCKVLPYGNKFSQLTEDMISEWDIDDELRLFDGAKQY